MRQCLLWFSLWSSLGANIICTVPELVQELQLQEHFDYVLLVGSSNSEWPQLVWKLPLSTVQIKDNWNISYHLDRYHSSHLLSIAFVDEHDAHALLEFLTLNLRLWNTQPLLLVFKKTEQVQGLLKLCWQQLQLLHVFAILEDFEDTGLMYSYSPFPKFQFKKRLIRNKTNPIIIPRLRNLRGYKLPVIVGGSTPRLIVYRRPTGELVYNGYVGHLMHCFEQKYNCSLIQPVPLTENTLVSARQLIGAVRNGSVQFALAATYPGLPLQGYTYPFEILNWCIMLPVPKPVPSSELYSRVLDLPTFLIVLGSLGLISAILSFSLRLYGYRVQQYEFLLHDNCLRGALGQSFNEVQRAPLLVRGIYLEICVLGILFTAWYNSYFSAYVTSAPQQKPFTSYDSLLNSDLKVVVWNSEYQTLLSYDRQIRKYEAIFKIEPDFEKYLKMRDSFNTHYGYAMPLEKWNIIKQQQMVFSSILFTMREDLCFYQGIPIMFPIAENSVFREPLERLIGEVTATGLMVHWRDMAFSEMIKAGKLRLVDLGKPKEFRAMQLMDLSYILMAGGLMMTLALAIFGLEQLWFHKMRLRRYLREGLRIAQQLFHLK
ncbi:uncharacterized protein LOC135438461 [Drosophila montana]|uniref:uncharacterized protein LOC135438461 n=1 Tax=Drosophila montana TaxID=40370 RepID=UPI00313EDA7C